MSETEIRSVLVPVTDAELLMPNASIAEIVGYTSPEPIEQAPEWLLGNILWHGWQVPVVSFGMLTEQLETESAEGAKICVSKSLISNERMPYIGILAQGFPRLVTVTESALSEVPDSSTHIAIAGKAIIGDREAWVPDLDRIGQLVAHAAFGALPISG
ncbi:MAG TPA: chemotaxis protein CheW [Wenzhouxiangellaceae bacterium]|nr:chemotaxis protein CheW [Wenzhouxiangellaceae bacterium]